MSHRRVGMRHPGNLQCWSLTRRCRRSCSLGVYRSTPRTAPVIGWVSTRSHPDAAPASIRAESVSMGPCPSSSAASNGSRIPSSMSARDWDGDGHDRSDRCKPGVVCGGYAREDQVEEDVATQLIDRAGVLRHCGRLGRGVACGFGGARSSRVIRRPRLVRSFNDLATRFRAVVGTGVVERGRVVGRGIRSVVSDGMGVIGRALMGSVDEDGRAEQVQDAHSVIEVFEPGAAALPAAAVTVIARGLCEPLRPAFRDRTQPGRRLGLRIVEDGSFELRPQLRALDDVAGRHDDPGVYGGDLTGGQGGVRLGKLLHQLGRVADLALHGAVADPPRRRDLGCHRPVRELASARSARIGFRGPVRGDASRVRQQRCLDGLQPRDLPPCLHQLGQDRRHARLSPLRRDAAGAGHTTILPRGSDIGTDSDPRRRQPRRRTSSDFARSSSLTATTRRRSDS